MARKKKTTNTKPLIDDKDDQFEDFDNFTIELHGDNTTTDDSFDRGKGGRYFVDEKGNRVPVTEEKE